MTPFKPVVPFRGYPASRNRGEPLPRALRCPQCGVLAQQKWLGNLRGNHGVLPTRLLNLNVSVCVACGRYSLWIDRTLVHPRPSDMPEAAEGMPASVKEDYDEARIVFADSPRSSAALLRLAIQKLCVHLGQPGDNLNHDIGVLVKNGLPQTVQMAMDSVRVIGNNAVHPGELNVADDPGTARSLFDCVNWTVEAMVTRPLRVAQTYSRLPAGARTAVEKRDRGR